MRSHHWDLAGGLTVDHLRNRRPRFLLPDLHTLMKALEVAPEPATMSREASTSQAQSRFSAEERRERMQIMLDLLDECEH
jgi:hypothetical protein